MPDIVSRIRVEAQGADQAAREIRKLKEAYDQVSESAKNLSPSGIGGGADPFSKATAAGGNAIEGGNSPSEVARREERDQNYRSLVNNREQSNQQYNKALRPQGVQQGFSVAEAMSEGRGGTAAGGVMGGLGGLLGGPAGMALAAGSLAAMGTQRLADKAFERLENVFGSGMSQRLGTGARSLDNMMVEAARIGAPQGMVQGFFQAAGTSGVNMGLGSTQGGINAGLTAATMLGLDPNAAAGLIGSLNRANVNASNVSGLGTFSMANQTFGSPNVTMFTQGLQNMIETASTRGIEQYTGTTMKNATTMGALAEFGGFAPQGAVQMAAQMQGRGMQAAKVQSPADVIAFQAMREEGASVTDTMIAMERDPQRVNREVYNYLKRATGGNKDRLRMRFQDYLGPNTSMSATQRVMDMMEETAGKSQAEIEAELGSGVVDWATAEEGSERKDVIETFAVRQNKFLKGFEDQMLELTTNLGDIVLELRPISDLMGLGGENLGKRISEAIGDIESNQNVENAEIAIENANLNIRETEKALRVLSDSRAARAVSTAQALRDDPQLRGSIDTFMSRTGDWGGSWDEFMKGVESGKGTFDGSMVGGWADLRDMIMQSTLSEMQDTFVRDRDLFSEERKEGKNVMKELMQAYAGEFGQGPMPRDITLERMATVLEKFEKIINDQGLVYTDGQWTYQGE